MQHVERLTQVKTKIVATVGPASAAPEVLRDLAGAGVDVFRVNLAHGTQQGHGAILDRIRGLSTELQRPLAVLADLPGPKIRLGEVPGGELVCHAHAQLELLPHADPSRPDALSTSHPELVEALEPGDRILLADGAVGLCVIEKKADAVLCRVDHPGTIRSRQGVHAPGAKLKLPALTETDRRLAAWAAAHHVDFIGLSFVANAGDVHDLRRQLCEHGSAAHIIAKIERAEALDCLESIIDAADGVMVARGDLGVEIDVSRVPGVQKHIIRLCSRRGVPVITATQMLESMQHANRPTRAEASDVANAILDGSDAIMLSGETAVGDYPVEAVATMSRIARETELLLRDAPPRVAQALGATAPTSSIAEVTRAVVQGADRVAELLAAKLIIVATHSGRTALALSKQRNFAPTVAASDQASTLRRLCLYWGVVPLQTPVSSDGAQLLEHVVSWGRCNELLQRDDRVVLVASTDWTPQGHNMILVHEVT